MCVKRALARGIREEDAAKRRAYEHTISSSKSSTRQGLWIDPLDGSVLSACSWPLGRWMLAPDGTTEDDRPWYPTGRWSL